MCYRWGMTPEELRAIMEYLMRRVRLEDPGDDGKAAIAFEAPTAEEMSGAGLSIEGIGRILGASWWDEMVADVLETPDMCEPGDPPEQVLKYARDVVAEYIRKRAAL